MVNKGGESIERRGDVYLTQRKTGDAMYPTCGSKVTPEARLPQRIICRAGHEIECFASCIKAVWLGGTVRDGLAIVLARDW